jgi:hypothetical protein
MQLGRGDEASRSEQARRNVAIRYSSGARARRVIAYDSKGSALQCFTTGPAIYSYAADIRTSKKTRMHEDEQTKVGPERVR